MVEFKTRVFSESDDEIIGAEVLVYSDNGQRLGSIEIVNAEDLESLQEELNAIPDVYVSNDDLEVILTNLNDARVINATTLSGYNSSQFAKTAHEHVTSDITNFPSSLPPSSHSHGHLTNDGAIGSTAGKPVITGENGVLSAGSFGSTPGTFCQGNDERLSNSRTPTSHAHGAVTNDGKVNSDISSVNKVVVTDGSNNVKTISVLPAGKLGSHTHSKSQITDFSHTHDDRYYTESEINTKLNGKANTSHTHSKSQITDLNSYGGTTNLQNRISPNLTGTAFLIVRNGWAFINFSVTVNSGKTFTSGTTLFAGVPYEAVSSNYIWTPVVVHLGSNGEIGWMEVGNTDGTVTYYGPSVSAGKSIRGSIAYPIQSY